VGIDLLYSSYIVSTVEWITVIDVSNLNSLHTKNDSEWSVSLYQIYFIICFLILLSYYNIIVIHFLVFNQYYLTVEQCEKVRGDGIQL